ncbi:MAG: preprotein translocase subunit YajC [Dehalococcoidia bacterium]
MDVVFVLLAVLAAFYFILLRPVINQQKKQRQDISSLEIGDEVLTTAGFYATVVEINTFEDRPMEILLEAAPGVVLRGTTLAIAEISRRGDDDHDDYEDDADEGPEPVDDRDDEDRSSSARAG